MKSALQLLSKFSVFDIQKLLAAKRLWSARQTIISRVQSLSQKLGKARTFLGRLDIRIARILGRNGPAKTQQAAAPARPAKATRSGKKRTRPALKGSLRWFLAAAIRTAGNNATARHLAQLALKAGYKTKSGFETFLTTVHRALHEGAEFVKVGEGKYGLRR
jgi:hypothetical protein